ncbi:hypothetical protein HMPREF9244_00150 [Alloscardovia omnicolens F0580]|uniref:Uncharacterized protein n=1 Tax=Alloscardovia omnicolens F0580 TaxID=1321816 RepID=U1QWF6_9BIFI|nr:hypothetical protein HMPREF9244_00150 [Alloscardovia omnicolens F0580]
MGGVSYGGLWGWSGGLSGAWLTVLYADGVGSELLVRLVFHDSVRPCFWPWVTRRKVNHLSRHDFG